MTHASNLAHSRPFFPTPPSISPTDQLGVPRGTIRATVLIETITAAFEMEEIIYELRQHSAGLNCGRWDYIFSFIKKFRNNPNMVLPNRWADTHTHVCDGYHSFVTLLPAERSNLQINLH